MRRLHRHRQARLGHRLGHGQPASASSTCCKGKPVVIGGTFFEVVYARDRLDEYKRWLDGLGITHVEISDGTVEIPRERKLELIADFARDFTVLSEVGSKDSEVVFAPYEWVEWITEELAAGAWKVITEGREGGTAGIYRPTGEMRTGLVDEIVHSIDVHDLVWEAPTKASQAWFIKHFGPDGQPRQHPAGRGHPARDAPPRPARRHAEGGAARGDASLSLQPDLETMSAEDVIRWAPGEFGERLCLTCSWQKQSSVLVHMVSELDLGDRRDRARHAPLLPRELRDARPARRALRPEPDPARDRHRRRAAPRRGPEPVGARSGPLLPHPQGRAAAQGARALRRVDLGHPPRPVAEPRRDAEGRVVRDATASGRCTRSRTGTRSASGPTSP